MSRLSPSILNQLNSSQTTVTTWPETRRKVQVSMEVRAGEQHDENTWQSHGSDPAVIKYSVLLPSHGHGSKVHQVGRSHTGGQRQRAVHYATSVYKILNWAITKYLRLKYVTSSQCKIKCYITYTSFIHRFDISTQESTPIEHCEVYMILTHWQLFSHLSTFCFPRQAWLPVLTSLFQ